MEAEITTPENYISSKKTLIKYEDPEHQNDF